MKRIDKTPTIKIFLVIAILSLLFALLLFENNRCFDKLALGQFGDFYGGVVATLAAILAGIYLYKTYLNGKKDSDFQIINRLFENIVQDINNLQYRVLNDENWERLPFEEQAFFTGMDAIYNFNSLHKTNPNSILNHLNSIINSFDNIIFMANKVRYKYADLKEITLKRIYFLYYSRILWPVWELEYPNERNQNGARGLLSSLKDPKYDHFYTINRYAEFSIRTIKFLSDKKIISDKSSELEKLKELIMVSV
jgi:hypothetical protein